MLEPRQKHGSKGDLPPLHVRLWLRILGRALGPVLRWVLILKSRRLHSKVIPDLMRRATACADRAELDQQVGRATGCTPYTTDVVLHFSSRSSFPCENL